MREHIMDISEVTHSREVYEAKPRPFVSAFIYIFLTILVISMVFLALSQMDIVTKAGGVVRTNQQVSTVKTLIAGEVQSIDYENGQFVNQGDTLFVFDHNSQLIHQELLISQITEKELELEQLMTYGDSILQGVNLFEPESHAFYYYKVEQFLLEYQIKEYEYSYEVKSNGNTSDNLYKQIKALENENKMLGLLEKSIREGDGDFSGTQAHESYYQTRWHQYLLSIKGIQEQYERNELEIIRGQVLELSENNLETAKIKRDGYGLILKSIQEGQAVLEGEESENQLYADMYVQYRSKVNELETAYQVAEENYNQSLPLAGIAITLKDVEKHKLTMENAFSALESFKTNYYIELVQTINELDNQILQYTHATDYELSKELILENNQLAKEHALSKYETDSLVAIGQQKESNANTLIQLEKAYDQSTLEKDRVLTLEDGESIAVLDYMRTSEWVTTQEMIQRIEQELTQLRMKEKQIEEEIETSIVRAKISGQVHVMTDITRGDTLLAGTQVLTIVPNEDTAFKVQMLLNNKDVAKIKLGDAVKYHFQALPNREYENLTGTITKMSVDAQMDQQTGQSYYLVEATLNEKMAFNYKGEGADVKTGMLCEAQIITDKKSILRFLLEKINLLD